MKHIVSVLFFRFSEYLSKVFKIENMFKIEDNERYKAEIENLF